MFDETLPHVELQRVAGRAGVVIGPGGRLQDLHQAGSAKVMLPKMHGRPPEVVFLNTAGGITGGDSLSYMLDVAPGARAVGTTQTAERIYRSTGDAGSMDVALNLGAGASLHWLPQEMILFDGARLGRTLRVTMPDDGELVVLETLVLGRAAMGETVRDIVLHDRREVIRGARPAMIEAIRLRAEDMADTSAAGLGDTIAVATLSLFAPDAEDRLAALRAALPPAPVRAAASAWDGRVTARFMAPEAYPLRRAIAAILPNLTRAPPPRVWQI